MAKSDIELRIIAKNEAQSVINSIIGSFKKFSATTKEVGGEARGVSSHLKLVGTALKELDSAVGNGGFAAVIGKQLKDAADKTNRLGLEAKKSAGELELLAIDAQKVADELANVRKESDKLTPALKKQETATARVAKTQKELGADERRLAAGKKKLVEANERLNGTLRKGSALTEKQKQANRDRINGNNELIRQFEIQERRNARRQETAQRNYDRERAALEPLIAKKRELAALDASLVGSQRNIAGRQRTARGTADRGAVSFAKQTAEVEELKLAVLGADAELVKFQKDLQGQLNPALIEHGQGVRKLKERYSRLHEETRKLALEIKATREPTREQLSDFEKVQAAARQTKQDLLALRVVTRSALRANRGAATDVPQAVARFGAISGHLDEGRNIRNRNDNNANVQRALAGERATTKEVIKQVAALKQNAKAQIKTTQAVKSHMRAQQSLRDVMNRFYGNNRVQLSILQRLRTELHGLALAYGGFFAIVQGINSVIEATKTIQKSENRLRSVVGNDNALIGQELDFVRRTAERLGAEFGVLSNEYGKLAVATKNTNLEGAFTRKIFLATAEAARVNGADNDALAGTFLALTQIVSKGTVTMEELKRQLGDRLPGAVRIMADALGVGTAELFKIIEAGDLSSDVLVQFADELDRRFGPGLSKALQSTQAQIGRLQNALFQTQLRVAEAGFLEAFNDLLDTITQVLSSDDFQSFADRMGGALGGIASLIGFVIENWRIFLTLAGGGAALKIAPILFFLTGRVSNLVIALTLLEKTGIRGSIAAVKLGRAWRIISLVMANQAYPAAVKLRKVLLALNLSMGSLAPILGLALAAAAALWVFTRTATTDANEVINRHVEIMDEVRNAYDKAAGSAHKLAEAIKSIPRAQLEDHIDNATALANKSTRSLKVQTAQDVGTPIADIFGLTKQQYPATQGLIDLGREGLSAIASGDLQKIRDFKANVEDATDAILKMNGYLTDEGLRKKNIPGTILKLLEAIPAAINNAELEKVARLRFDLDAADRRGDTAEVERISELMIAQGVAVKELEIRFRQLDTAVSKLSPSLERTKAGLAKDKELQAANKTYKEIGSNLRALNKELEGYDEYSPERIRLQKLEKAAVDALASKTRELNAAWLAAEWKNAPGNFMEKTAGLIQLLSDSTSDFADKLREVYELTQKLSGNADFNNLGDQQKAAVILALEHNAQARANGLTPQNTDQQILDAVGTDRLADLLPTNARHVFKGGERETANNQLKLQTEADKVAQKAQDDAVKAYNKSKRQAQENDDKAAEHAADSLLKRQIEALEASGDLRGAAALQAKKEAVDKFGFYALDARQAYYEAEIAKFDASARAKATADDIDIERTLQDKQMANYHAELELTDKRAAAIARAVYAFSKTEGVDEGDIERFRKAEGEAYDLAQRAAAVKADKPKTPQELADELAAKAQSLIAQDKTTRERFIAERANVTDGQYAEDPVLNGLRDQAKALGISIPTAIDEAIAAYKALEDAGSAQNQQKIAELELLKLKQQEVTQFISISWEQTAKTLGDSISAGVDTWIEVFVKTRSEIKATEAAFASFASSFLIQIGQMIQQQAALAIANKIIGGLTGGFLVKHGGGLVGSSGLTRRVSIPPAISPEYHHNGGIAGGLRSNEVPAVLEKGEEVLRADSPRHINNIGKGGGRSGPVNVTTIVVKDEKEANDMYLDTPEGEGKIVKIVNNMLGG